MFQGDLCLGKQVIIVEQAPVHHSPIAKTLDLGLHNVPFGLYSVSRVHFVY